MPIKLSGSDLTPEIQARVEKEIEEIVTAVGSVCERKLNASVVLGFAKFVSNFVVATCPDTDAAGIVLGDIMINLLGPILTNPKFDFPKDFSIGGVGKIELVENEGIETPDEAPEPSKSVH